MSRKNQVTSQPTLNRDYEEWAVSPLFEQKRGSDGSINRVCTGFEKNGLAPIRTTRITPDKAEILNSQSESTGVRLFEVEQ